MKKVNLFLMVLLTVVFLSSLIMSSHHAKAAPEEPIKLTLASWSPPMQVINRGGIDPWIKEVEKRTGGKVKITNFPGASLGKPPDHYDLAVKKLAHIATVVPSFSFGRFPLSGVMELPFLAPNPTASSKTFWELYKKFPEIQKEFGEVKVIAFFTNDPMQIHTSKKPIRALDDLKGLKIRAGDKLTADMLKTLGATPIFMSITDVYIALERGTIDGAFYTLEAVRGFKLQEVSKYCTVVNFNCLRMGLVMNLESWNSLQKDIQGIIGEELGGSYFVNLVSAGYEADIKNGIKAMEDAGNKMIYLPPDEIAKWKKALMPIREEWVKEMKSKNLPGGEVLDEAIRLIEKYSK